MNFILCPERKGKVPRHSFHPPRSQSWLRGGRSQLAILSGQVPTPYPVVIPEGVRHPAQLALNLFRMPKWESCLKRLWPKQMATAIRFQRQGWGRSSLLPQYVGQYLVEDLGKGSGALQGIVPSLFPGPSSSPTGPRQDELEGLQEKTCIFLFPHLPPSDHHTTEPWLNHFPNCPSLTVTCRQGPLCHWTVVEQDN